MAENPDMIQIQTRIRRANLAWVDKQAEDLGTSRTQILNALIEHGRDTGVTVEVSPERARVVRPEVNPETEAALEALRQKLSGKGPQ